MLRLRKVLRVARQNENRNFTTWEKHSDPYPMNIKWNPQHRGKLAYIEIHGTGSQVIPSSAFIFFEQHRRVEYCPFLWF
jgi:hypothetical protein